MARVVVRNLTIFLAIVGLVTVAGRLWRSASHSLSAPDALTFVTSQGGRFKAAHASWFGGGGFSPYCYDRVFVIPVETAADKVLDESNLVFEGDCGSFAPKDGRVLNSPELSWRDARVLVIKFSILGTAAMPATFRLRRQVASGQVGVEFEVAQ